MSGFSRFWWRISWAPFESLIGGLVITSGALALLHIGPSGDILDAVLPGWAAAGFQIAYVFSGLLIIIGLGAARADIESAGLVIIASSQVIRAVSAAVLLGLTNAAVNTAFAVLVVWACIIRLRMLLRAASRASRETE